MLHIKQLDEQRKKQRKIIISFVTSEIALEFMAKRVSFRFRRFVSLFISFFISFSASFRFVDFVCSYHKSLTLSGLSIIIRKIIGATFAALLFECQGPVLTETATFHGNNCEFVFLYRAYGDGTDMITTAIAIDKSKIDKWLKFHINSSS